MKYKIPDSTRIGHSHLKVSDIGKALAFYQDILGFEITQWYGNSAVFLSAGGYHHHIGLNTWYSKGAGPAPRNSCGLFHTAILYSTRKELAIALKQILRANYPLTGPLIMAFRKQFTLMIRMVTEWKYIGISHKTNGPAILQEN
jgi:catechol 2,3-dioxygenase